MYSNVASYNIESQVRKLPGSGALLRAWCFFLLSVQILHSLQCLHGRLLRDVQRWWRTVSLPWCLDVEALVAEHSFTHGEYPGSGHSVCALAHISPFPAATTASQASTRLLQEHFSLLHSYCMVHLCDAQCL